MAIPPVVIRLEVSELKNIRYVYLLDLFEGRGEKGRYDLVFVEHLWMIGLMVLMLMSYSRVLSALFILSGFGPVLSRYGIEWQKVCSIVSVKRVVNRLAVQEFNISYILL